jgi:hypothetical protein
VILVLRMYAFVCRVLLLLLLAVVAVVVLVARVAGRLRVRPVLVVVPVLVLPRARAV